MSINLRWPSTISNFHTLFAGVKSGLVIQISMPNIMLGSMRSCASSVNVTRLSSLVAVVVEARVEARRNAGLGA